MQSAMTLEQKQNPWWLLLLSGILNLIVGILLLTSPIKTTVVFVWVLGVFWFVEGILTLVSMFIDHSAWGWKLFIGLISIVAGITVMRYPVASAVAIPAIVILLLGIQGVITGIVGLVLAFRGGGWGAAILSGLSLIFGVILILNYTSPSMILTLVWVVAILAIAGGAAQIFQALKQR